jgi:hypothetical protein
MSSRPTDIMTLDAALEQLFSTMQAMDAVVTVALAWETTTLEDENAQRHAHLLRLFLRQLREAYSVLLENISA